MEEDFTGLVRKRKTPIDARVERLIVTGMIVSDRFVREVQPLLSAGKFQSNYTSMVAGWCSEYWRQYGKAPGKSIEDLFFKYQKSIDEEQVILIQDFLSGISEEYERGEVFNAEYVLDTAESHFRLTGLKNLHDAIGKEISAGRAEEGEVLITKYQRPTRLKTQGVDPLRDINFISDSVKSQEENPDVLFTFPGALGQACGPLERGFLIAFQAESGVGKTWWLWFLARTAVLIGLNVVFFSLEMSEKKMARRIWQDLTGSPTKGDGDVLIPVFDCLRNQTDVCTLSQRTCKVKLMGNDGKYPLIDNTPAAYKVCSACKEKWDQTYLTSWWKKEKRDILDPAVVVRKYDLLNRSSTLQKAGKLHLVEFPTDSLTVGEMSSYLDNLEYYDNFIPDVIITDYADKFKWDSRAEPRHSIDRIWASHKGLAQQKHCLVATASQSNTERSGKKVGKGSWAESIEKRRGIDLGLALNQTLEESEKGLLYMSVDKMRHEEAVFAEVAVLQNLAVGRPYLDSCFVRRTYKKKGE